MRKLLSALVVLGVTQQAAWACGMCQVQIQNSMFHNQVILDSAVSQRNMEINNDIVKRDMDKRGGGNSGGRSATGSGDKGSKTSASVDVSHLNYAFDPKLSAQFKNKMMQWLLDESRRRGRLNPELEASFKSEFAKLDITNVFVPELSKYGLRPHNTASAVTAFVSVGYAILLDKETLAPTQIKAINRQIAGELALTKRTSDVDMQKFSEGLYWTAYINALDWGNARNGVPGYTSANVKASVTQTMKQIGLDPEKIRVGNAGLERKS
jgi:hypothetical protein